MPPLTPGTDKRLTECLKASFASWEKEVKNCNITKGTYLFYQPIHSASLRLFFLLILQNEMLRILVVKIFVNDSVSDDECNKNHFCVIALRLRSASQISISTTGKKTENTKCFFCRSMIIGALAERKKRKKNMTEVRSC